MVKQFALIMGIVFVAIGVMGFIPGLTTQADHPEVTVDAGEGYIMGIFPTNVLHNIVHLISGVAGIALSRSFDGARLFARVLAVMYGLLTVMGLFPVLNTTFGLIPIFGNDVWLHAVIALAAAYFGFLEPARTTVGTTDSTDSTARTYTSSD
jgi:hypothetical protein